MKAFRCGEAVPRLRVRLGVAMQTALRSSITTLFVAALLALAGPSGAAETEKDTYDQDAVMQAATDFLGETTKGLAKVIEKIFEDQGEPNAFIAGEEISGAIGVGLRYGNGMLSKKGVKTSKVYWQGPSIGFDFGGNASKVFTLIYHLKDNEEIFQRIPGAEGTIYVVAGVAVNYQQSGDLILAPIRTGVGLRGGINIGYLHYAKKHSWIPF